MKNQLITKILHKTGLSVYSAARRLTVSEDIFYNWFTGRTELKLWQALAIKYEFELSDAEFMEAVRGDFSPAEVYKRISTYKQRSANLAAKRA